MHQRSYLYFSHSHDRTCKRCGKTLAYAATSQRVSLSHVVDQHGNPVRHIQGKPLPTNTNFEVQCECGESAIFRPGVDGDIEPFNSEIGGTFPITMIEPTQSTDREP